MSHDDADLAYVPLTADDITPAPSAAPAIEPSPSTVPLVRALDKHVKILLDF